MRYVAGIDGGSLRRRPSSLTKAGRWWGAARLGRPITSMKVRARRAAADACAAAFASALASAGLSPQTRVEAAVAGISGYTTHSTARSPRWRPAVSVSCTICRSRRGRRPGPAGGAAPLRHRIGRLRRRRGRRGRAYGRLGLPLRRRGKRVCNRARRARRSDARGRSRRAQRADQPALEFFGCADVARWHPRRCGRISRTQLASFAPRVHDARRRATPMGCASSPTRPTRWPRWPR